MIKTIRFKTSFYKEDLFTKFKIKQDDIVRFEVDIEDAPHEIKNYNKAKLLLRRADKTVLYEEINVTHENGFVIFNAPNGTTSVNGVTYGELEFTDNETFRSSTFVFVFDVISRSANINEAIESKDEIFIIKEIRDFIKQVKNDLRVLDTNVLNLQLEQQELNSKMEFATEKADELIEEVLKRDLNVAELKTENIKAEIFINEIKTENVKASNNIESMIVLSEEAIKNIDMIKNNAYNIIIDEKDNILEGIEDKVIDSIEELSDVKTNALKSINETYNNAKVNLDNTIDNGSSSISGLINAGIVRINNNINNGINQIDIKKDKVIEDIEAIKNDFENSAGQSVTELENVLNDAKNINDELKVGIESGTSVISNINININNAEKSNVSLQNKIEEAESINETLSENILVSNTNNEELLNTIETAETVKNDIEDTLREGSEIIPQLNEKVESLLEIENLMHDLILRAENDINELNILHPEADIRIEELRRLIEEAKRYEEVVRRWIDKNEDGKITSEEVLGAIEELRAIVDSFEDRFNDYYTKTETDEIVDNIKERLFTIEKDVKEIKSVGLVGDVITTVFEDDTIYTLNPPEIPFKPVCQLRYKVPALDMVVSFRKEIKTGDISLQGYRNNTYVFTKNITQDDIQVWAYNYSTNGWQDETATWLTRFTNTTAIAFGIVEKFYYHDFEITDYNTGRVIRTNILDNGSNNVDDFNLATRLMKYRISIPADKEVLNSPVKKEINGVLYVEKNEEEILQKAVLNNGEIFIRVFSGEWNEWRKVGGADVDLSEYITEEQLNEALNGIEIPEIDLSGYATKNDLEDVLGSIEIPTIEHLATKEELKEGLKLYIEDIGEDPHPACYKTEPEMLERETHYIRYKTVGQKNRVTYLDKYVALNYYDYVSSDKVQVWRIENARFRTFEYNAITSEWTYIEQGLYGDSYIRIYTGANNTSKCSENVYSTNIRLMNKNGTAIIVDIKEGDPQQAPINNYDDATKTGNYYVYHQNAITNSYTDNTEGILKVVNTKGVIHQELISSDDTINVYRIKSNNVWTEWKEGASNIDLSSLATKEELEAKANEIIGMIPEEVDLSPYATKEEVDNAINNIEIPTIEHLATKEELEKGLKLHVGNLGEDPHPVCYKTEPEPLERETHYIRYKSYDKKYRITYLSGYIEPAYDSYVSNNKVHIWRMHGLGVSYRTFVYESGEWKIKSDESIIRVFGNSSDINTCLESVYSTNIRLMNKNKTEIIVDVKEGNPQEAPINNYNNATETGNYYVYHQNAIPNSYVDNTEAILKVVNTNGIIHQELISNNEEIKASRIKSNNVWTDWKSNIVDIPEIDMENIYTKEEVDEIVGNISGGSSDGVFDNEYRLLLNNTIQIMKERGIK